MKVQPKNCKVSLTGLQGLNTHFGSKMSMGDGNPGNETTTDQRVAAAFAGGKT